MLNLKESLKNLLKEDENWKDVVVVGETLEDMEANLIIEYLKRNTPEARQKLVMSWDYDNSLKVIKWITEQPDTDKGSILRAYWNLAPAFSKRYEDRRECEEKGDWYLEHFDIIEIIEKNYLSGFYKTQIYAYNPEKDLYRDEETWQEEISVEGMKREIPQEMFVALEGKVIEKPNWKEGVPNEIAIFFDKLCDGLSEED